MSLSSRRHGFLLLLLQLAALGAIALIAGDLHAQASSPASYAGAWRLDDRASDSADTVQRLLREAGRSEAAPAAASSASVPSQGARAGQGGRRGGGMGQGMGRGMAGAGMGGEGVPGHGGRGGRGGRGSEGSKDDKGQDFRGDYPLPPTLAHDSVLLVQQDAQSIQVRFADGAAMEVRTDGQSRQTLAGNAMVSAHREDGGLYVSIHYADGSALDERWTLAPDGKRLTVLGEWRVPGLAQPVSFRRGYVGLP